MGILPMMSHLSNEETSFNRQSLWLAAYIAEFNLSYLAYFFFFFARYERKGKSTGGISQHGVVCNRFLNENPSQFATPKDSRVVYSQGYTTIPHSTRVKKENLSLGYTNNRAKNMNIQ